MQRVLQGTAHCSLCGASIRPEEDALVTPDFLADEADPLWRFSDVPLHRACFLVWDRRRAFIARFNAVAGRMVASDGSHLRMTIDGDVRRTTGSSRRPGPGA